MRQRWPPAAAAHASVARGWAALARAHAPEDVGMCEMETSTGRGCAASMTCSAAVSMSPSAVSGITSSCTPVRLRFGADCELWWWWQRAGTQWQRR